MPLDPQAKALLDRVNAANPTPRQLVPVETGRRQAIAAARLFTGPPTPVAEVTDMMMQGPGGALTLRIYTPAGNGPFGVLVFAHGGGWTFGNLETHDNACRTLASGAGCVVVAVDYRLAPEHPFPAALDDYWAAVEWVAANAASIRADPARIAVGGDSAGGNLAAAATLLSRDRGGPSLAFQLLIYPAVDYYKPGTPSYQKYSQGYWLTYETMAWFWDNFVPDAQNVANPYAFPIRATNLRSLPAAHIILARYDPLLDEGERYAARLQEAGVPVTLSHYDDQMHAFFTLAGVLDRAREAQAEAAAALKKAFS